MADVEITKESCDARHGRYVARIADIEGQAEITPSPRAAPISSAPITPARPRRCAAPEPRRLSSPISWRTRAGTAFVSYQRQMVVRQSA